MKTPRWKTLTDSIKHSTKILRVADFLGRGRGRLRWFDQLNVPPAAPRRPDLSSWENEGLAAAWLGHATVLIRVGGMTVLTDPVFANRVGIGLGLVTGGPRRHVLPALAIEELPPIDLILISHAHYDHLDRPTLTRLPKATPVITSDGTSDLLRDLGYRKITELRWGERATAGAITVTAQRVAHWGARSFYDAHRGYNAYILETRGGPRHRVVYGGDSAYGEHFRDVAHDRGRTHLAIVGIGGYNPWVHSHATPEQAWQMADQMNADFILPMHHSTFRLSHEPTGEPMERLMEVAGSKAERVVVSAVGGQWAL
ncbi:MAG: MBL fold metallo-hydrolase [Phycisphaerae bacterium]|nr:MBL fold metallo-hydrolase [Tepidisphaeraceae bacterium]